MGIRRAIGPALLVPALAMFLGCGGAAGTGGETGEGGASSGGQGGGGGPCGAQSCATGCCDDNGVCQAGTSDSVCGTANIACQDCSLLGQTCQAGECSNGTGPSGSGGGGSSSSSSSSGGRNGGSSGGTPFPTFDAGIFPPPTLDAGTRTRRDAGTRPVVDASLPEFDAGDRFEGGFPDLDGSLLPL